MPQRRYFISYRRSIDGVRADAITSELRARIGDDDVFFDRHPQSLPPGVDWPFELISAVAGCETLLPIIGPEWLNELTQRNRSPNGGWRCGADSSDWVLREIAFALQFGKRVVALLVDGAVMPPASHLPEDLQELSTRQCFAFPSDCDWKCEVDRLLQQLLVPHECPGASPPPPMRHTPATPDNLPDDENHPVGRRWDPRTETDSPHIMDYKYCILDPELRHRIRVQLLAASQSGELRRGFTLAELKDWGEPRKYLTASVKKGMFFQASCLVSDGMANANWTQALVCIRDNYHIHDITRLDPRNVRGESCLIGTCLTSFELHRGTGHLPGVVLNDLAKPNPWAVFSRKLLIPDSVIDCRFLGIGFNLSNPDKEYVHLIWHVRTRGCPEVMLVPAREEKHYDVPVWQTKEQLAQYDFETAPIDRAAVEAALGVSFLPEKSKSNESWLTGFVRVPGFDGTQTNGFQPVRWQRDTVPLDLLRMFQQRVHRRQLVLESCRAADLLAGLADHIRGLIEKQHLPVVIEDAVFHDGRPPFDRGLHLIVTDEAGRNIGRYLIVAAEWTHGKLTGELVAQVRERAEIGFGNDHDLKAVLVLHGVHTDDRFEIQGAVSLHDPDRTPIHVVRVALGAGGLPVRRIAHAIIPVCCHATGEVDSLVVTLSPNDEGPRLPGGKIEGEESAAQAVCRELAEELGLASEEFEVSQCVLPDGVNDFAVSPSTGLLTHYRIFPFVVKVIGPGLAKMRRRIAAPSPDDACRAWPETFKTWTSTGFGYDTAYPRMVLAMLTSEQLRQAAICGVEGIPPNADHLNDPAEPSPANDAR